MSNYFSKHLDDQVELWKTSLLEGEFHYLPELEEVLLERSSFIESFTGKQWNTEEQQYVITDWKLSYTGFYRFYGSTPYFFYTSGDK